MKPTDLSSRSRHLITPSKEEYGEYIQYEMSDSIEGKIQQSGSISKASSCNKSPVPNEKRSSYKSPFSQQSSMQQVPEGYHGMMLIQSPCRDGRATYHRSPGTMTPRILLPSLHDSQRKSHGRHQIDASSIDNMSYNSLKSAEKQHNLHRPQSRGPASLHTNSSEKEFKFNNLLFSNRESPANAATDDAQPDQVYPQKMKEDDHTQSHSLKGSRNLSNHKGAANNNKSDGKRVQDDSQLSNDAVLNALMKIAYEKVTAALHQQLPTAYGNLIMNHPKFLIQIENQEESESVRSNHELQKLIYDKLRDLDPSYNQSFQSASLKQVQRATSNQQQRKQKIQNAQSAPMSHQNADTYFVPPQSPMQPTGQQKPMSEESKMRRKSMNLFEQNKLRKKLKKQALRERQAELAGQNIEVEEEQHHQSSGRSQSKHANRSHSAKFGKDIDEIEYKQKSDWKDLSGVSTQKKKAGILTSSTKKDIASHATSSNWNHDQSLEQLNRKRKNQETPNLKSVDFQTPSTKKKCNRPQKADSIFDIDADVKELALAIKKDEQKELLAKHAAALPTMSGSAKSERDDHAHHKPMSYKDCFLDDGLIKKECCGCKKTKCLKLYCECFQAMRHCTNCNCNGCMNKAGYEDEIKQAMDSIQMRNSGAFDPKAEKCDEAFENTSSQKIHSKGCNCKRSDCRKKYCECFQMGAKCTNLCKCLNCKNHTDYDPSNSYPGAASNAISNKPHGMMPQHSLHHHHHHSQPHPQLYMDHYHPHHLPQAPHRPPSKIGPTQVPMKGGVPPVYYYQGMPPPPPPHMRGSQQQVAYDQWNQYYQEREASYGHSHMMGSKYPGQFATGEQHGVSEKIREKTPKFNTSKRQGTNSVFLRESEPLEYAVSSAH